MEYVEKYKRHPQLVAILVGGNESSKLYIRNKQRVADYVGCSILISHQLFLILIFVFYLSI